MMAGMKQSEPEAMRQSVCPADGRSGEVELPEALKPRRLGIPAAGNWAAGFDLACWMLVLL